MFVAHPVNAPQDHKITLKRVMDFVKDKGDESAKEINRKLQHMLEETLTKNMHLQKVNTPVIIPSIRTFAERSRLVQFYFPQERERTDIWQNCHVRCPPPPPPRSKISGNFPITAKQAEHVPFVSVQNCRF